MAQHQLFSVVTDVAVMENDPVTCALRIVKLMPGVSVQNVLAETGFQLQLAPEIIEVDLPASEDLRLLRDELDPDRVYLKEEGGDEIHRPS